MRPFGFEVFPFISKHNINIYESENVGGEARQFYTYIE